MNIEGTTTMLTSVEVKDVEAQAQKLATKLASNTDLTAEFENAIEVAEDNKRTTFAIHLSLKDMFTVEELDTLPVFDSKEWERPKGSNEPFDKFKFKDPSTGNEKTGSYYRMVAAKHPIGVAHLNRIKEMNDSKTVKNAFSAMNEFDLNAEKKSENARYETYFTKFRLALSLFAAMKAGNELGTVEVDYVRVPLMNEGKIVYKEDGKTPQLTYTSDPQCIIVRNKHVPSDAKRFTIPNFLRLDVDVARKNGGTYEEYITSNKREPSPPEGVAIKIENVEQFEGITSSLAHFFIQLKANPKVLGAFIKHYNMAGSDDRLWTLSLMKEGIELITELPEMRKRIDDMLVSGKQIKLAA